MNAKRFLAMLISVLTVISCLTGMMFVSADEADEAVMFEDATHLKNFNLEHVKYFTADGGATLSVDENGNLVASADWSDKLDQSIKSTINLKYFNLMKDYWADYSVANVNKVLSNRNGKYKAIVFKVKFPAISADSWPYIEITCKDNSAVQLLDPVSEPKYDGSEEYWVFDLTDEPDTQTNFFESIKIIWADASCDEDTIDTYKNSTFTLIDMKFYATLDDALAATGVEKSTEAPTEKPTEAPETTAAPEADTTAAPADETKAPAKEDGCGAVIGTAAAVGVLTAVAAAVVLKKKD